jgi:predicted lipoprotein with Yx(FWY)xxD motif
VNGAPHSPWIVAALTAFALAGCAGPAAPPDNAGASSGAAAVAEAAASAQAEASAEGGNGAAQPSAPSHVELWAVQSGPLGVVVTDGDGKPIYRYDRDGTKPPTSACTGDCTQQWPPVVLSGNNQPELDGVDPALVGTLQRPDGQRQLTLAGWPLYRHTGDDGGLSATYGNGADGAWFAISPNGGRAKP